jgi:hypothetical protein
MLQKKKKIMLSTLQVKNKPRDGEAEHAFILESMDCTVANNYSMYSTQVSLPLSGNTVVMQ